MLIPLLFSPSCQVCASVHTPTCTFQKTFFFYDYRCVLTDIGVFSIPSIARQRRWERFAKYAVPGIFAAPTRIRLPVWEHYLYIFASFVQVSALVGVPFFLFHHGAPFYVCVLSSVASILLSFAWLPSVHKWIREVSAITPKMVNQHAFQPRLPPTARIKAYLFNSLFRMVFTISAMFILFATDADFAGLDLKRSWTYLWSNWTVYIPLSVNIGASFLSYQCARLACVLSMQRLSFALSLFLVSPTCMAIALGWSSIPFVSRVS
jgi:hypothetical protein